MRKVLNKLFKLDQNQTTISTELLAGLTTFITMAYSLAVIPAMLSHTGMSQSAIFFATCLGAGVISILMGLFVNFPVALAPGLGFGAYFATIADKSGGISWELALGIVFISGIVLLILTVSRIAQLLNAAVPNSLKHAITVGIGLFIALIGLKMSGLISIQIHVGDTLDALIKNHGVASLSAFEWNLMLGKLSSPDVIVTLASLLAAGILTIFQVRGAILLAIIFGTLLGIPLGITHIHNLHFAWPSLHDFNFSALHIRDAFQVGFISIIFTFTFIGLMDTFATLISTATRAGITKHPDHPNKIGKAMVVSAVGANIGAFLGIPTLTVYLESLAGITAGGKTGLTAVTVGILFLIALFLCPIFLLIPAAATAPALIIIGTLMAASTHDINFHDFEEGLPAFLTIVLIPLTYNIANGISAGIVFYIVMKIATGKWREIHWLMYVMSAIIVLRYLI